MQKTCQNKNPGKRKSLHVSARTIKQYGFDTGGGFFFIFFLSKDRRQHIINESDASGRKYGMRKTQSDVSRE